MEVNGGSNKNECVNCNKLVNRTTADEIDNTLDTIGADVVGLLVVMIIVV